MSDLISRQDAIDELDKGVWGKEWDKALAKTMLESLPSAQPERNTGKWIDDNCSVCGFYVHHGDARNYCPNCGAKMEDDHET